MKQQDDIFVIKENVGISEAERYIECYTVKGKEQFLDEAHYPRTKFENNSNTHAKLVSIGESKRYYIKFNRTGRIFDPCGLYDEIQQTRESRHASRPNWKWRQVSERVFLFYLEYLKTRNKAFFINAERSIV